MIRNPFSVLFERRSAIGSTEELYNYLLKGVRSLSGQSVNETTAMNVAAVMTGVNIRARLLSTLPVTVIEKLDGRSSREALTHPVRRVLLKPNSWQTRSELFCMEEAHRILRGNAFAWKNVVPVPTLDGDAREQIAEIIPMHPDRVQVEDSPDDFGGPTTYNLHRKNGQILKIPAAEVIHLKSLSTDGVMGRSFLQDMREVIGGSLASQSYRNSLWANDSTPPLVLTHPKTVGEKARKNLEESWEKTYGAGKDKRRVAILEEGMSIEKLALTPQDTEMLATDQDLRAQLAAALLVPPHLMGLAEKSTSWGTGIEQQQIGLMVITMRPDLTVWEERLNRDLITNQARFQIKFNERGWLRGDTRTQAEALWRYQQMGVYSPNDIRALLDENPIEGGDVYLKPTNMAPLGWVPAGGDGDSATTTGDA